ncbi:hypothetical protein ACWEKR_04205 [Nocardia sp. NPDC004573]
MPGFLVVLHRTDTVIGETAGDVLDRYYRSFGELDEQGELMVTTVRQIVWEVVGSKVPEERWLLESLDPLDDEQVSRSLRRAGARWRGPLRFGIPDAAPFVVPLVWMVVEQLSDHATGKAVDAATKRIGTRVRAMIGRRPVPDRTVSPVSPETLRRVRNRIIDGAIARGFDSARAEELAEEVVAQLREIEPDIGQ